MPRPRPPSRIDTVTTPLFGMCWFTDYTGETPSLIAYCGGGGSAATGVKNFIGVRQLADTDEEPLSISTGNQVGVALTVVQNPVSMKIHLFVAMSSKVVRYSLPDGTITGEIDANEDEDKKDPGKNLNAVAVNAMTDRVALGCDDGTVLIYSISDDDMSQGPPLHVCMGHEKAVCALQFAPRSSLLASSAKDGTARLWRDGQAVATLKCSILDPRAPPPKRAAQILVRGCAFGDLEGKLLYTVASGRRGKAYLTKWGPTDGSDYDCLVRTEISACPISAMSLSKDGGMIAFGAVDGSIILWNTERWRKTKVWSEVHALPVTCIAARPLAIPLNGEEEGGVRMHALSASADSQLAWLSLSRAPKVKKARGSGGSFMSLLIGLVRILVRMIITATVFYPVAFEIWEKCGEKWGEDDIWECIRHDALIARDTAPGIATRPY